MYTTHLKYKSMTEEIDIIIEVYMYIQNSKI
jgi:hypothetical protein